MARLSANGWRDNTRRIRGAPQWQQTQAGNSYYDGGHSRGDSGSRYDSSSTREPEASPRHSEASSRHDSSRPDEGQSSHGNSPQNQGSEYNGSSRYDAHKKFEAGREPERSAVEEQAIPKSLIDDFDQRITSVQQEISSSLQEATSKENEKFDLIFSILIELQRRQTQLEESLKSIKTQLQRPDAPVPILMGAPVQQQPGQMQNGSGTPSSSPPSTPVQVSSPMGQQQMCFPAGQIPMGQQCGNMMSPDGSMQMVFVMGSPSGNQMPFAVPQPQMMCPAGSVPAMQQPMPVHFVPQGQGNFNEEYQMGSAAGGSPQAELATAAMDGSCGQPQEGTQATTPDGQSCQVGAQIEEE